MILCAFYRILGVIEELTEFYPISQTPQPIVREMFGCSLYPALGNEALSFSPELGGDVVQLQAAAEPTLTLSLPASLSSTVPDQPALSFCAYKEEGLFTRRRSYLAALGQGSITLASNVVSARLSRGVVVTNLKDPVRMSFSKIEVGFASLSFSLLSLACSLQVGSLTSCSFWDQSIDSGYGGWSSEGCKLVAESADSATCECNHLTNFGILVDSTVLPEKSVGRFMIIGAVILLLCVLFVLVVTLISQ